MTDYILNCKHCEKEIETTYPHKKFCSSLCQKKWNNHYNPKSFEHKNQNIITFSKLQFTVNEWIVMIEALQLHKEVFNNLKDDKFELDELLARMILARDTRTKPIPHKDKLKVKKLSKLQVEKILNDEQNE